MKKYLFFDLEFEQLYDGTPTSCEFGYVLTNKCFNIFKTGLILINPNLSNFELEINGSPNYRLRSNINNYLSKLDFSFVYSEIKQLFNESDMSFGFGVNNDANILNNDCKRYCLPTINQKLIDVQEIYSYLHKNKRCPKLKDALASNGIKTRKFKFHNAQSDAIATLFLLKKLLDTSNMTIRKLINRIPGLIDHSNYGFVDSINKKQQHQLFNYLAIKQKCKHFLNK